MSFLVTGNYYILMCFGKQILKLAKYCNSVKLQKGIYFSMRDKNNYLYEFRMFFLVTRQRLIHI